MLAGVIQSHPNRTGLDLGENLFVVLLVMAPSSQELEPPANPGRFSFALGRDGEDRRLQESGRRGGGKCA